MRLSVSVSVSLSVSLSESNGVSEQCARCSLTAHSLCACARYWTRTSDPYLVEVML
jgi:hypothetical protein